MKKRNSVKQIVEFLDLTVIASERQIQKEVFGYYRGRTLESNKKYAEMLRRGVDKGLYKSFYMSVSGLRSKVFYYKGNEQDLMNIGFNKLRAFAIKQQELLDNK
jgi:hypothetical protein